MRRKVRVMSGPGAQLAITPFNGSVHLRGDIDAHTAPQLAGAIDPLVASKGTVEIDLAEVEFMDSSGLRVFIASTASARELGGDVVLRRPSALIRRLLEVSGLTSHLTVIDN